MKVTWDAFVCVLNAWNFFYKKIINCPDSLNIYATDFGTKVDAEFVWESLLLVRR